MMSGQRWGRRSAKEGRSVGMGDDGLERCWAWGARRQRVKGERRARGGLEDQKWESRGD